MRLAVLLPRLNMGAQNSEVPVLCCRIEMERRVTLESPPIPKPTYFCRQKLGSVSIIPGMPRIGEDSIMRQSMCIGKARLCSSLHVEGLKAMQM